MTASESEPADVYDPVSVDARGAGAIQPHGAMLVCDPSSYRLLFVSRNAAAMIGCKGELARGGRLEDAVGEKAAHDLRNAAAKATAPGFSGVVLGLHVAGAPGLFNAMVHTRAKHTIIEIEPCPDKGRSTREALDLTRDLIHRIGLENDVQAIADAGANLVRAMLGYERATVCRFLHNGAGRVIAESGSFPSDRLLGQHFPASDISARTRRRYLGSSIRMIADLDEAPVPLEPLPGEGEEPVDLSFSHLRSISPAHSRYLRNMGVRASLSISVIVDGALWGLIACHHQHPKTTPIALRLGAELFGQYFSLQIAAAERRAALLAAGRARAQLDAIVSGLSTQGAIMKGLVERLPDFAALVDCDGAALWMDGVWTRFGSAPDRHVATALLAIVDAPASPSLWTTQELGLHLPETGTGTAGVLAIPLSLTFGDYLMLFRNEEGHDVEWSAAHERAPPPRSSFQTWREEVKGRSMPWTEADISVAEAIGTYLRDVILRQNELSAEERARTEQRRRILHDELNHRIKNIIALVKSIVVQTGAGAGTVAEYSTALEGRLRALAFAHDQSLPGAGGGDLAALIEAEACLHREQGGPDRIAAGGPRLHFEDRAFGALALVVHEMMTNAAKYGALSVPEGKVRIEWSLAEGGDCVLEWRESAGPRVARPTRTGFGTRLIRSVVEYDLRGSVHVDYAASGLEARFVIPGTHAGEDEGPAAAPGPQPGPDRGSLAGLSVLVVEDQGLIAMDAEETLRRLGAAEVRLAASAQDAMRELETFAPDAAVLDFNLGKGTSEPVADMLAARGVPFVFATGYSDRTTIPARFREVPVVRKPISDAAIAAQLGVAASLLGQGGA